ncbi:MAG: hypothetical protein MK101_09365 [Phycisphaerales bacterium]|nr:hypothetical protein [Phycisphaerales bacterium]
MAAKSKTAKTSSKTSRNGKVKVIKRYPTANDRTESVALWHDSSLLRRLYEEEGKSQGEIAQELGCSLVTVNKAFKKAGIKAKRGRRPTDHLAKHGRPVNAPRIAGGRPRRRGTPDLRGLSVRERVNELADMMDRLGPQGRDAVRQDLHDLIDRL